MTKSYVKDSTQALLIGVLLFLVPAISLAQTDSAKATGNWNTAAIWSLGTVPTAANDAVISAGYTVTITSTPVTCKSLTVRSTGTLVQNANKVLNIVGSNATYGYAFSNSGTFTATGGTVAFTGSANQLITSPSTSLTFYNLTIANTGTGTPVSVGGSLTVLNINDSLTLTSGTFTAPDTINIKGDWNNSGGTFTPGTNLVNFVGTAQLIDGTATSQTFYNATVSMSTAAKVLSTGASLATLNIGGNLSLTKGTFTAPPTINISGNWIQNTTATFTPGAGTVNFIGTTAQSFKGTAATQTFNNVNIASTQTVTVTAGTTLDVNGNMTLTSGTFKPLSNTINLDGNWINNGATFTYGTSTVNFIGTANQMIGGIDTTQSFYKINVNDPGYTVTVTAPCKTLTIYNSIILTSGTFAAGATTVINGGYFTNNGGTFNPDSNLVEFTNGYDTINGTAASQTFYNVEVMGTGKLSVGGSTTTVGMHNLTLKSGAVFTAPATINMYGNWINDGATFNPGTNIVNFVGTVAQAIKGTVSSQTFYNIGVNDSTKTLSTDTLTSLNIDGNLTLSKGTFKAGADTINIYGNWTNNYATFTSGTSTVNFLGTTAQTIGGVKASQTFYNINVNDPSQTVTAPTTLYIDNSLTLTGGDFVAGKSIYMKGTTWTDNGGAFTPGAYTVYFTDTLYSHVINGTVASQTFYNVVVNDSGQTVSTGGSLTTINAHNLTLTAGTFIAPATLNLSGNFVNNDGEFTQGSNTVSFNGAAAQKIRGTYSTTFNNLTINNTAGGVSLGNNETVTSAFTLTNGVLTSYADSILTVTATGTATSGNATSYVSGPMTKVGNTAFVFPLGNNSVWADFGITAPQNSNNNVTAEYYATSYAYTTPVNAPLTNVSTSQYWTLEETSPDNINVTLYWESGPAAGIYQYDSVKAAEYDGTAWNSIGNILTGTSPGPGTVTSTTPISTANELFPFTLGTDGGNNPLPITLTSFTATYIGESNSVLVNWSVASQLNNKEFIIEKTLDGINYTEVGTVAGAGTTPFAKTYFISDPNPTPGISYYRLKQLDMDGNPTNFPPAAIFIGKVQGNSSIILYPSPVSLNANLNYIATDENPLTVDIIDITGRTVSSFTFNNVQNGENNFTLNTSDLNSGIYFIRASEIQKVTTLKFIKL